MKARLYATKQERSSDFARMLVISSTHLYFEGGKQTGEWTTYDAKGKVVKVTKMNPARRSAWLRMVGAQGIEPWTSPV
jgi:hypothetical protein